MGEDVSKGGLLARREIEARITGPLIRSFVEVFGRERILRIAEKVLAEIAREKGTLLKEQCGGDSLEHFARGYLFRSCEEVEASVNASGSMGKKRAKPENKARVFWCEDGAIKLELLERQPHKLSLNVMECLFSEMYQDLGLAEFGYLLSCGRDFPMIEGFNPKISMQRTQTVMEGAENCDFRFELPEHDGSSSPVAEEIKPKHTFYK